MAKNGDLILAIDDLILAIDDNHRIIPFFNRLAQTRIAKNPCPWITCGIESIPYLVRSPAYDMCILVLVICSLHL